MTAHGTRGARGLSGKISGGSAMARGAAIAGMMMMLAGPALARDRHKDADAAAPPLKVVSLIVYGNDPCPRSAQDEIVVCGREPESERFRIPKRFRDQKKKNAPAVEAWSNTVRELDYVSQRGLPNSCSPVGSNGATGCYEQFLAQARAEREADRQDAANKP